MSLIATGSFGIDTIETPSGEKRENLMGGSCAYFAAAASFYTQTRISGVAGKDFPEEHKKILKSFNIDLEGLELREGKTFRWGGKYLGNMDDRETTFVELNVLAEKPATIPESYKDSEFVFLANASPTNQRKQLAQFPKCKLSVADTMNLWIDNEHDELIKLIKEVDGLVLNLDEAVQLTGKSNTVAAAKHLLELGPKFVVVKKGEHGCIFAHKDGIGTLPAFPTDKVIDPTGAGDTFAGGMMGFLASQDDPASFESVRASLAHGTIMASFTIEKFSLERLQELKKEELEKRFKEFTMMLHL